MQSILDFASREPITTMIIAAAVVCVLAAFAITRHRRRSRAHRDAELPPLVFAVHDRTVPDLRPAGFRGHSPRVDATPPSPPQQPANGERPAAAQRPTSTDTPARVPRYQEPGERGADRE
jgi:hypothetical protein